MSFNSIIGQETAKRIIKNDLAKAKIASSYLFCGERGVGKKLSAINFAKALNCYNRGLEPCDTCLNCKLIESDSFPDCITVKKEEKGSIKIERVRNIKERLHLRTRERRVVIVEDVDTMTSQAQNAFLKILEEPPFDTTIILTTSKLYRLFPTIISRCKIVKFRRLRREEIKELLKEQGLNKIDLIGRLSGGSIERAKEMSDLKTRDKAVIFLSLDRRSRLSKLGFIGDNTEGFIDSLYIIYGDLLLCQVGLPVRNSDLALPGLKFSQILRGMETIHKGLSALKQNVNKEHILAYLAYNLPKVGIAVASSE